MKITFFLKLKIFAALAVLLVSQSIYAQITDTAVLSQNIRNHINFLASDKLHGRLTGSKDEKNASTYISNYFKQIGLAPKGENGTWLQPFNFYTSLSYGKKNELELNGKDFELEKDFYPIPYSCDSTVSGEIFVAQFGTLDQYGHQGEWEWQSNKISGKIVLFNLDTALFKSWREAYEKIKPYKPAAIIFYNSDKPLNIGAFKKYNSLQREHAVLLYAEKNTISALREAAGKGKVKISVHLQRKKVTGHNVIGYIDNGKPLTVIIGAHYDHLGYGEFGNSLYVGPKAIHNGADDNASGTAAMMELARLLKNYKQANTNFLFMAFSGEEEGLLGSNAFVHNPTISLDKVDYMINMDMVGRLDSARRLELDGTGTSPTWDSVINNIQPGFFKIKSTPSGIGPSDFASFYLQRIPVLEFFTGSHPDYHKPSDKANKINYPGEVLVINYMDAIIQNLNTHPRLVYVKTKDETEQRRVAYKVTLGIMPDYAFEGPGLRINDVVANKPAQKAGLQAGDILMKVGNTEVKDMSGYMEVLSKLNKGDKSTVEVKRGDKIINLPIEF